MQSEEWSRLMASERIRRIGRAGSRDHTTPPPAAFRESIVACLKHWDADRRTRHLPTGLIYHYCDASALMGMLKFKAAWATSTKYLNDTTELLSFTSNFEQHANRHRQNHAGEALADIVDFYRLTADTSQTQTIGGDSFACCFSEAGDLLSQWRAYGNNGRGYAVGFDPRKIAALVSPRPTVNLRKITYGGPDETAQVDDLFARFEPIVETHLQILDNTGWGRQSARNWLSMRFGECLLEMAEEIKHPAFAEEREWRLYAHQNGDAQFRVSQDRIVPFKQIDLSSIENSQVLPIEEIVIGPRLDFDEAVVSLTTFTSTLGYGTSMKFRESSAPYR
jgi:hypothetical protein